MEKIGDIAGKVAESFKKNQNISAQGSGSGIQYEQCRANHDIESLWFKLINEDLRAHSYIERVNRDTLFVRVDSSCYMTVLKMQAKDILGMLQNAGWHSIKYIKFRM